MFFCDFFFKPAVLWLHATKKNKTIAILRKKKKWEQYIDDVEPINAHLKYLIEKEGKDLFSLNYENPKGTNVCVSILCVLCALFDNL